MFQHCIQSASVTCSAAPLTAKIIYGSQCVSTFWDVSIFSLFKTVTIENSASFRQNQDMCIQCLSPFLDSQWKIKGGVSLAGWQLGAKLLLESTQTLAPEHKLWNIFICSTEGAAAMKWHLRQNNLICRWCHRMAHSIQRLTGNIVPAPQSD